MPGRANLTHTSFLESSLPKAQRANLHSKRLCVRDFYEIENSFLQPHVTDWSRLSIESPPPPRCHRNYEIGFIQRASTETFCMKCFKEGVVEPSKACFSQAATGRNA